MASQGFQQVQRQVQSMVLAPQLRQSLKILQVSALELRSTILDELQINPVLEELAGGDVSLDSGDTPESGDSDPAAADDGDTWSFASDELPPAAATEGHDELHPGSDFSILQTVTEDWREYWREESGDTTYTSEDAERRQHFFDSLVGSDSLQQHLLEQARLAESDPVVLEALEFLIGSLDDNGFLATRLGDLALMARLPLAKIQAAAALLRTLEPVGIGAENTRECLLLQLQAKGEKDGLAARIIRHHWDLLLRRRIPEIARKLRSHSEDVQDAIARIGELDPAPGRRFAEDTNRVVIADVRVRRDERGEWQVVLNNDYIPRLRLSQVYKNLLAQGALRGKDREYVREQFRNGRFLINAIEQRQQTIERITRQLLVFQADFFAEGTRGLKPLTMNQIASVVGVHETTISRAIANKFIDTPHGVFDFKYFFTSGYQSGDGSTVSNTSVKERIAKLVAAESPAKPLSDQRIAEILKDEGVDIARRTVAKYREELGILPTNLRRQYG
jgi:RNA polymerase sigma-54 factor